MRPVTPAIDVTNQHVKLTMISLLRNVQQLVKILQRHIKVYAVEIPIGIHKQHMHTIS